MIVGNSRMKLSSRSEKGNLISSPKMGIEDIKEETMRREIKIEGITIKIVILDLEVL